jgi:hypothetical protein
MFTADHTRNIMVRLAAAATLAQIVALPLPGTSDTRIFRAALDHVDAVYALAPARRWATESWNAQRAASRQHPGCIHDGKVPGPTTIALMRQDRIRSALRPISTST